MTQREAAPLLAGFQTRAKLLGGLCALLWAVELVDLLIFHGALDQYGIQPRSLTGLRGILFAPFLHSGLSHLMANTLPFLALGFLSSSRRLADFFVVSASAALVGGLGTWLIGGSGTVHIGASGVIFGYLGFLMGRGIWERRLGAVALSLGVGLVFGGMIWGLLPFLYPGVSWEGHLFGFIGGLLPARTLGRALRDRRG